jgi:hypothetical protein
MWGGKVSVTSQARALGNRPVKIKENSARAHILRFGLKFVFSIQTDYCGQAHVEAPHQPSFLRVRFASVAYFPKALFPKRPNLMQNGINSQAGRHKSHPLLWGQALIAFHFIDLPAVCKSKKTHGTESVNARAYLGGMVRRNAMTALF